MPGGVRCNSAFANAVEHRFALLEQGRDLLRLETERLALDAAGEEKRAEGAEDQAEERGDQDDR